MNWAKRNLQFPSTPWFAKKKRAEQETNKIGRQTCYEAVGDGARKILLPNVKCHPERRCMCWETGRGRRRPIDPSHQNYTHPSVRLLLTPLFLGLPPPKVWLGSRVKRIQCHSLTGPRQMMTTVVDDYGTHRRKPVPHNFVGSYSSLPRRLCVTLFILLLIRLTNDNNKRMKRALFIIKNKRSTFFKKWGGLQPHLNMRRWM
jgi:hypothetical protein